MMWSKNTNGNLMIGKGKDRKRAEERKGGLEGEERHGIGADVSQEIWRNERSRGRSWRTKLSNEFPLFRDHFFVSTEVEKMACTWFGEICYCCS